MRTLPLRATEALRLDAAELATLARSGPFAGMSPAEIAHAAGCLGARVRGFAAGDRLRDGPAPDLGVLLRGRARVQLLRPDAASPLTSVLEPGEVYGEDSLWPDGRHADRLVTALTDGAVLLVGTARIERAPATGCALRGRVVENLFRVFADKHSALHRQLETVSQRSLRARVLAYLADRPGAASGAPVTLPLSRADLAAHLGADRAALSRELGRMRDDGLIEFDRNTFRLRPAR